MNTYTVKDILGFTRQEIHHIPKGEHNVIYDDGTVVVNRKKEIIFNRYIWELFLMYPGTPIYPDLDVKAIIGKGYFNGDTHVKSLQTSFKHICDYNNIRRYSVKEPLLERVYQIANLILNEIIHGNSEYVSTIDPVDFIKLIREPAITKIHNNLRNNPDSIERAYREIKQYVNDKSNDNHFVQAYRSKSVNENQANQSIGPRGYISNTDRTVIRQPIMNGFIVGMQNLFEIMAESLTAAKALNATDVHIQTSEYASRRIQLLTMSVNGVDINDCGSQEYAEIFLTQTLLRNSQGKWYLTEDGRLDYIRGNETHLVGNVVKFRHTLYCKSPHRSKICTTCLGKVSENFNENSNLGYIMTAFLMEKFTQNILGTKHLTHSVKKHLISLLGAASKYFYLDENNDIYFHKDFDLTGLQLILPNNKLGKLVDVLSLQHTNVSLSKVGELETITIRDTKVKTPTNEVVDISYKDRLSTITKPFLEYLKNTVLDSDSRGNFVVPMDNFNKNYPIFNNPIKEVNIISFLNRVASMIETTKDKITDPLDKFISIVSSITEQIDCNMSVVEVVVYAITTFDAKNNDYRLGRNSPSPKTEGKTLLFRNRSISQLLIFEDQMKELLGQAPIIFSNVHRSDHPADILFSPQSFVK